ncbi:GNAT family N-acetyltransferase [Pseudomonas sp. SGAir0191]|uniref:GNAT family N-acetyltransferase n=1 Tax=Pseudomonas TaxID=286 RepID=UPI00073457C2|nr:MULTISPECIES: GNAT family N-acetyltransferase [Pseudomonas]AUA33085.1 GNAT family N-acetyltransferase [Pseudomonas sp. SGAir0191]KTS98365.1 acetyltransferase domain protein [Pseudomonas parafulva]
MDVHPTLFTDRLVLTRLCLEDVAFIQEQFPQWEVVRYLDSRVPWPYPADGALAYVRDIALPGMAAGCEWHWMIRMRDDPGCRLGSISLFEQPGNNRGFWLAPQWWGRGYMREACAVVTAYWFETLARPIMQVPKAVANHASRRVSEFEGMRLVGLQKGWFVSGLMDVELWQMTRVDWLANTAAYRADGRGIG